MNPTEPAANAAPLQAASVQSVRAQLALEDPGAIQAEPGVDPKLDARAEAVVQSLMALDPKDLRGREDGRSAIETMGLELQKKAAQKSHMLKQPIRKLTERAEDGGEIANSLVNLKMEVEELDPGQLDLEPGWFTRMIGMIPGVGTPLKRYLTRYESAQTVIEAIVRSLEQGRDQLLRDNSTLVEDQRDMREMTHKLEAAIRLAQLIDTKLEQKLQGELPADSEQHRFVAEELLFPLRQRVIDLQQQLAVNQQGFLATEIIIRNNKELARGVNRALNVTTSALHVGATVALALADQKIVIDKVEAVNKTASDLIAGTAERLKTQGTQIHKQAASAQLDVDKLKMAFKDLNAALDDLSSFRQNALPQMAQTVLELDQLSAETEKAIQKIEQGNTARPKLMIDVES